MPRWWARQDSNLGPRDYESPALPLSYGPGAVFRVVYTSSTRSKATDSLSELHSLKPKATRFSPWQMAQAESNWRASTPLTRLLSITTCQEWMAAKSL